MPTSTERRIQAPGVRSLVWDGEELGDWVAGGTRYSLNGEVVEPRVFCAYPFDAAVALAGSAFAVIYTRLGTKGLVLRDGQPASFVARLIERGIEPDLRQEGLSLVFAVFPVKSLDMGQDLPRICIDLKTYFIEATAKHRFDSHLRQFTYSPFLCSIGPRQPYALKLSHRPSERHVFASAVLDVPSWRVASHTKRRAIVADSVVSCIERIRESWLAADDRADLMTVFLAAR